MVFLECLRRGKRYVSKKGTKKQLVNCETQYMLQHYTQPQFIGMSSGISILIREATKNPLNQHQEEVDGETRESRSFSDITLQKETECLISLLSLYPTR